MTEVASVIEECLRKWPSQGTEARRLFHGRGQSYPGLEHLTVTAWPPYIQISTYKEDASLVKDLVGGLNFELSGVNGIFVQARSGRTTASRVVSGAVPQKIIVTEAGLKYEIRPLKNQNAGLFLDMGHVRQDLATLVEGKHVLNLFAYTCAFSVSALHHGATSVVNIDMSRAALEIGALNHRLNDHDLRRVRMLPHNIFKSWWKLRQLGPFDVMIIDPPAKQKGSFVAEKSYGQILKRLPELVAPGATVVAALNSPFLGGEFLREQIARWVPDCPVVSTYPLHPDFPDACPDRALKVMKFEYR